MSQHFWSTNKAHFTRDAEGLRKRYFRAGDANQDSQLLRVISSEYPTMEIGGWQYRPLRLFGMNPARNELLMEYVEGENLGEWFNRTGDPSIFVHAGRWLGGLHRATKDPEGWVLVFNDYNRTNIIADKRNRTVVAVDPGNYCNQRASPSRSFVVGSFSITRAVLRRRSPEALLPAVRNFVSGYNEATSPVELSSLGGGFRYLLRRFRMGQSRTIISRPVWLRTVLGALECLVLWILLTYVSWRR